MCKSFHCTERPGTQTKELEVTALTLDQHLRGAELAT